MSKWYVVHRDNVIGEPYSSPSMSKAIAFARMFKACYEVSHDRDCRGLFVVKIDDDGEWYSDGTQKHFIH